MLFFLSQDEIHLEEDIEMSCPTDKALVPIQVVPPQTNATNATNSKSSPAEVLPGSVLVDPETFLLIPSICGSDSSTCVVSRTRGLDVSKGYQVTFGCVGKKLSGNLLYLYSDVFLSFLDLLTLTTWRVSRLTPLCLTQGVYRTLRLMFLVRSYILVITWPCTTQTPPGRGQWQHQVASSSSSPLTHSS